MKKFFNLVVLVSMTALITACAGEATPSVPAEQNTVQETPTPSPLPEPEVETEQEDEEIIEDSEITITHELGEATVNVNPTNVVVFDYGFLDALDSAGVSSVVGIPRGSSVPEHLQKYDVDDYANIGSLKEADFEKINELKPELILISGRMEPAYEDLNSIAPTVFLRSPAGDYMETFEENIGVLAEIFTNEADKLMSQIDDIKARSEALKEAAAGKSALIIQTNDDAISVFGYGSRYSVVYTDFGFTLTDTNIEAGSHGVSSSFEYIVEQNPEYLFVVDRSAVVTTEGATGAEKLLDNDLINGMDVAKNGKIFYLNSTNWYTVSGGVVSTQSMIAEIEAALGIE